MNKKKKYMPIKEKIVLALIPIMVIAFFVVFLFTFIYTQNIMIKNTENEVNNKIEAVDYHIMSDLNHTIGIIDSIAGSIEQTCSTDADIERYIMSVADTYPDIIPSGIYCGLENGMYIDKMWTPDADWVMKERPWYIEGLKADNVEFGEMYLDADTGKYIISIFKNIKNKSGKVIGVISADVPMDSIVNIIEDSDIFEEDKLSGVDIATGLMFGNIDSTEGEKVIYDSTDDIDKTAVSLIEDGKWNQYEKCGDSYVFVHEVTDTGFALVYQVEEDVILSSIQGIKDTSFFTSLAGIIALCIAVYFIVAYFLKPINKLSVMIYDMEKLDFGNVTTVNTKDEIGKMSQALNSMSLSIKNMISDMKDSIHSIDMNANTNTIAASSLYESSEVQNQSINNLTNTMTEMSNAIDMIAEGASDLAGTVSDTAGIIEDAGEMINATKADIDTGYKAMNNMTETMDSIVKLSDDLKNAVEDVNEGLIGIAQMVDVINDIAEQTSLLSLNASIEAARAGDAGKGFAVVADEIRKLADTCSSSVSKINESTDTIKELVKIAFDKTEQSSNAVMLGGKVVYETETIFNHISSNVEKIHSVMNEVGVAFKKVENVASDMAASTQEQTASTSLILETSEEIKELSKQFSEEGKKMNDQSQNLKELSNSLDEQVALFKGL